MNRCIFILAWLALCCLDVMAQNAVTVCEYWIDRQFDNRTSVPVTDGTLSAEIDLAPLDVGLHSLSIRVADSNGIMSAVLMKYFMVLPEVEGGDNGLTTYEYWLDRDFENRVSGSVGDGGTVSLDLDIASLDVGLHSISMRVNDKLAKTGAVLMKYFMVLPEVDGGDNGLTTYEYWLDRDFENRVSGSVGDGGTVSLDLDIASLDVGLHSISMRTIDKLTKASGVLMKYFMVTDSNEGTENAIACYEYWIDSNFDNRVKVEATDDDAMSLDLDIEGLKRGMHTFNCRSIDDAGQVCGVYKKVFMVNDEEQPMLAAYGYWLNDGARTDMATEPQTTLNADLTIDIDSLRPQEIRQDYTFDVATGLIHTGADITLGTQVFNAGGVGSMAVVDTIKDVTLSVDPHILTADVGQTYLLPAMKGGEAQGYRLEAEEGDSIRLQVSGKELTVDFYDADGKPIVPDVMTEDATRMFAIKPEGTYIYALAYGVLANEGDCSLLVVGRSDPADVNRDGSIDTQDVLAIYGYMQDTTGDKSTFDVNHDGSVDTQDVLQVYSVMQANVKKRVDTPDASEDVSE